MKHKIMTLLAKFTKEKESKKPIKSYKPYFLILAKYAANEQQ